jgi:hypothetical protein
MNPILIFSGVFITILGSGVFGILMRRFIPPTHLEPDAKDVIRLVTGITATMSGLVLGLLVSSASAYYQARVNEVAEIASDVIGIDNALAKFGPESGEIRVQLRVLVEAGIDRVWDSNQTLAMAIRPQDKGEALADALEALATTNSAQIKIKAQVIPLIKGLQQSQWQMFLKTQQVTMPLPLLLMVVSWIAGIFFSIGIFAPRTPIVLVTFAMGALTVASAAFIIVEMYSPFKGMLRISAAPLMAAISQMRH